MDKLYNTTFETSLRIGLLMSVGNDISLTAERVTALDFMAVYGGSLGVSAGNLHGDGIYKHSEFVLRRNLVRTALKDLVSGGLATVRDEPAGGYVYSLTESGAKYADSLTVDYAVEYRNAVRKAIAFAKNKSDRELISLLNGLSIESLRRA